MSLSQQSLAGRLNLLGVKCGDVPLDRLSSATAALACFPMYMVSNLHAWTPDTQFKVPLADIPGWESLLESFTIGRQERSLDLSDEHRRVLGTLLRDPRPTDRVVYEYALETLGLFLESASPAVVEEVRAAIARQIVAVAQAAGEGWFGSGEKVDRYERELIQRITDEIGLRESAVARDALQTIGV
ncbi:MAG TPA: hypothetical protein VML55_06515 [Planctomycetaceae bacterium]|nr:hypothetical protein [Planctomycetaceae bacterium]